MASHALQGANREARSGTSTLAAFGQWLLGLFVIGAAAFIVAYHVPLHRAHKALTAEQASLVQRHQTLGGELAGRGEELTKVRAAHAALQKQGDEAAARTAAEKARIDGAFAAAREKLANLVERKLLSLEPQGNRIVVSFAPALVQGLHVRPPSAMAAMLGLCEVVAAVQGARGFEVMAYPATAADPSGADAVREKWEVPGRLGGRVASAMESACGLPAGKVSVAVLGGPSRTNTELELAVDLGHSAE